MSHSLASLVVSVRCVVSLAATFLVAHFYRRLDCRAGVVVGTCMTGIGFAIYAFASSFPVFIIGAIFAGLGYGLGGAVGSTLLIGRWYRDGVGKAAGFAAMGSGAAGAVIPLFAVRIIASAGLRASFLFEVGIIVVVAILAALLLRNKPSDLGLAPHTKGEGAAPAAAEDKGIDLPSSLHRALVVAMFLIGGGCIGGVAYVGILMTSNGISEVFTAALLSALGIALVAGKFFMGILVDAIGSKRASMLFFGLYVIGLVLCCLAPLQLNVLCMAAAVIYGFGAAIGSTGVSVWSIEFSHRETRAKVARDLQSSYAAGGFLFNLLPGVLMELTGSYVTVFALMTAGVFVSMLIVATVYRHLRRRA